MMAVYILAFERFGPTTREAEAMSRLLAPVSAEEVVRIRISKQAGKQTTLERNEDGTWRFKEPVKDRVNTEAMKAFLDQLSHLTIRETLEKRELGKDMAGNAELGFADAEVIEVEVKFEDGSKRQFLVGATAPFKDTLYIQAVNDRMRREIYMIDGAFRPLLANPTGYLRDRQLIPVHPTRVVRYTMKTQMGEVELVREPDLPRWHLKRPLQTRANDDIAFSIIQEVCELSADEFLETESEASVGRFNANELDANSVLFKLRTDVGEEYEVLLKEKPGAVVEVPVSYAKVSGRNAVFEVPTNLVSRLPSNVNQIRYPFLADLERGTVGHILIRSQENVDVELRADAQRNWYLTWGGSLQKANKAQVEDLLRALNEERVLEFRSDTAARLERYGLERPLASVTVSSAKVSAAEMDAYEEKLAAAQEKGETGEDIAKPNARVESKNFRFGLAGDAFLNANIEGEPFIYAVDPAFLANLPTHPLNWRGLQLLDFDYRWFRKVEVQQLGAPPLKLQHNWLTNDWRGMLGNENINAEIDRVKARRLLETLGSLRAVEWLVSRLEANKALETPIAVINMELVQPSDPGQPEPAPVNLTVTLAPAAISNGQVTYYFGRFGNQPDAFLLDASSFELIVAPITKTP